MSNIFSAFWMVVTYLIVMYAPEYVIANSGFMQEVVQMAFNKVSGIEYFTINSKYRYTMLCTMTMMWIFTPFMFFGYIYSELRLLKVKEIKSPAYQASGLMIVFIYAFLKLYFGIDNLNANTDGIFTKIFDLVHTNVLFMILFTGIWFIAMTYSLARVLVIIYLACTVNNTKGSLS